MLPSCSSCHFMTMIKLLAIILAINGYMTVAVTSKHTQVCNLPTLNIGGFFAMNDSSGETTDRYGREIETAVQFAIEEINNSTSILPGYRMKLFSKNTQVSIIANILLFVFSLSCLCYRIHTSRVDIG